MSFVAIFILTVFGIVLGSFAGASVWRLRARQLVADQQAGEAVDTKELAHLKKLTGKSLSTDRSQCLHCGHELTIRDLIPLVSWVGLKGRCRYCHQRIGYFEPLIEIGTAVLFVGSLLFWPFDLTSAVELTRFILWLTAGVGLVILFAYDAKWFLLPDVVSYGVVAIGAVTSLLVIIMSPDPLQATLGVLGSVAILSGLYLLIYILSRGAWIGFGDVKLGLGLGLLLADWRLALVALFSANLIGCLIIIPLMISGRLSRQSHIPFGPLLIGGAVLALLFGGYVVDWYAASLFLG